MSETERAWAAGFFDGEGSITYYGKIARKYTRVTIGQHMRQKADLQRFIEAVGGVGNIAHRFVNKTPMMEWSANSREDVATVRDRLWPYLGAFKKSQWDEAERKALATRTPKGAGGKSAPQESKTDE